MAFKLANMDVGLTPPIAYAEVAADKDVVLGEALVLTDGVLTTCPATQRPEFIAAGPKDAYGLAPVVRVQDYQVWEAELSADGAALHVGDKVTLDADGLRLTATTASGVAQITAILGTAPGDPLRVRF